MARNKPVIVNPSRRRAGAEAVPGWRVMYGNLRARHRDHDNSLSAFVHPPSALRSVVGLLASRNDARFRTRHMAR